MCNVNKIDTIQKILAKAKDRATTPAEAAMLMEKAKKLADKAGLSLDDIKTGHYSADEFGAKMYFGGEQFLHPAASLLFVPVSKYCGIEGYRRVSSKGHWLVMYGHDADVELAQYLLRLFTNTLDAGWNIYKESDSLMQRRPSPAQVKAARKGFVLGFCAEISNRLQAHTNEIIAETGTELIVLKGSLVASKYEDYCKRNGIRLTDDHTRNLNGRDYRATAAGQEHAKSVNMGRGVNAGGPLQIGRD